MNLSNCFCNLSTEYVIDSVVGLSTDNVLDRLFVALVTCHCKAASDSNAVVISSSCPTLAFSVAILLLLIFYTQWCIFIYHVGVTIID